jgi:hypothetical protein
MKDQTSQGGVLREEWDTDTRTYTAWSATGVQTVQRPFTAAENTRADTRIAAGATEANEATLQGSLGGGQVFDNLRTIATGTGLFATAATRDAAIRTCARALVILIRLQLRRLDATD